MKKLLLLLAAVVLVFIILGTLGPLLGLAFALAFVFLGMHYYVKSNSVFSKVIWIFIGLIGLLMAVSNIPALVGLVAIVLLYALYKNGKMKILHFLSKKRMILSQTLKMNGQKLQNKERF